MFTLEIVSIICYQFTSNVTDNSQLHNRQSQSPVLIVGPSSLHFVSSGPAINLNKKKK